LFDHGKMSGLDITLLQSPRPEIAPAHGLPLALTMQAEAGVGQGFQPGEVDGFATILAITIRPGLEFGQSAVNPFQSVFQLPQQSLIAGLIIRSGGAFGHVVAGADASIFDAGKMIDVISQLGLLFFEKPFQSGVIACHKSVPEQIEVLCNS
jgi:hypothetical protein